jgi:RNA polymerase sigma-70 factor (ECF subfamily)
MSAGRAGFPETRRPAVHPLAVPSAAARATVIVEVDRSVVPPPPTAEVADATLVVGLRARSPQAFELLVASFGVPLRTTARRILRDQDEADDALQETFVSVLRAIETYEGRSPLSAWLQQIAVNACLMRLRKRRRRAEEDLDEFLPEFLPTGQYAQPQQGWGPAADENALRDETIALVRGCVDELPDKFRVPLVLRDLEGMDYETIAARMELTVNAVKIRVHRGRQALRTLLDPHLGPA